MQAKSRPLTRDQIGKVFPTLRGVIAFENLQDDTTTAATIFSNAPFITTEADGNLGSERVLTGSGNVTVTDGGAGGPVTLDLSETGVAAATYGSATKLASMAIDVFGRTTSAAEFPLESGNVTETTKLFFTDARARAALSGGSGINYNSTSGVIATAGFTGTGAYTNFTIVNGIVTAAS
jgi:hypothetical protein